MIYSTYSDISHGHYGMGYAYIVCNDSQKIIAKRSGLLEGVKDTVLAELLAIVRALEAVPVFSEVKIHSDLSDIQDYMAGTSKVSYAKKLVVPVALIKASICERDLDAQFIHMPRGHRPGFFKMCHRESRIQAGNSLAASAF